jgi:tetratricopeptide (TPR) repeat protein
MKTDVDSPNAPAIAKLRVHLSTTTSRDGNLGFRFSLGRTLLLMFAAVLAAAQTNGASFNLSYRPSDPLNQAAFNHFYNLDYDRAIQEFQQVLQRHPDDPFAVNHLLTAILFHELYRVGALNTSEYANDSFVHVAHRPADPAVQKQIKDLVQRATNLEEQMLKANPNDVNALYARGVTRAQFATYTGLIERAWFSALRNALGARHDHERVLELDPSAVQAKLVVGVHNYVVGSLPWGAKFGATIVGLGGNKEKGLRYLRDCASGNGETAVDAQMALILFLRREHEYPEALNMARSLIPRFPQNMLLPLEEANLLRVAGDLPGSAAAFRKVFMTGKAGKYPGLHYEAAALGLGDVMRTQKDYQGAADAYEQVAHIPKADPDILLKGNLAAGEMYDLLRKRDAALAKYQAVIAADSGSSYAETARKYLKEEYRE